MVDSKTNLEIESLSKIIPNITTIKNINKDKYEEMDLNIQKQLNDYLNNENLDEKTYNICIETLNNIFNFYVSGYPNIQMNIYIKKIKSTLISVL